MYTGTTGGDGDAEEEAAARSEDDSFLPGSLRHAEAWFSPQNPGIDSSFIEDRRNMPPHYYVFSFQVTTVRG